MDERSPAPKEEFMDRPLPWLKYVDADDLDTGDVDFGTFHVENPSGEKLGDVDGFIVHSATGDPHYVVVDSGGWFKSKHYLIPVGHVRLDAGRSLLLAELTRERIDRFPGFYKKEFDKLTDEELERVERETAAICCPDDARGTTSAQWSSPDRWLHHKKPDWWTSNPSRPDRAGAGAVTSGTKMPTTK
jgi:hypothetical protein